MLLEGIFPAITTPFYPDGSLYLRKLEHNVALYSRTQLPGMVVLGSTGEAVMLSLEEQREVLEIAIAATALDKVMVAGVGQESVRHTIAMAQHAASLHYDAVLVRTPHFYRKQLHRADAPQTEMLTYYRTVADHSPLPVLLYSVPPFTQYDLPIEVIAELAQHPNIVGIKDSRTDCRHRKRYSSEKARCESDHDVCGGHGPDDAVQSKRVRPELCRG
jgi:dihydrodipicolinate synthase/N-acetylneuraminate lyase